LYFEIEPKFINYKNRIMSNISGRLLSITCVLIIITSCDLVKSVDDYEPLYSLPSQEAITDDVSAELALTGAYSALRQQSVQSGNPQISIVPSILGITAKNGSFYTDSPENHGWAINEPI